VTSSLFLPGKFESLGAK